jgi:hypothetical protein
MPIFAKQPPVPPGFTHQVFAPAGLDIPAINAADSATVDATERAFLFIVVLLIGYLEILAYSRIIASEGGIVKNPKRQRACASMSKV